MAHILVVDDEKSIRITVGEFLRADGHEVELAEDADKALAALKEGDFDVVVSDIILPRVTGVELLKRIRVAAPRVQAILMTGEPTVETAAEALRAGAFDYLFKPIAKDAILKAVANAAKLKATDDERRRLEEENQEYQANLEQLVEERTAELRETNRHLEEALKTVAATQKQVVQQERLRALGEMASGIAHDFNNTLTPIMGYSELLLMNPEMFEDRENVTRLLETILAAAQDASNVVHRLREFYRTREQADLFRPVNLNQVVKQVITLTRPRWQGQAQETGVDIRVQPELGEVALIRGDESELREVLINLIFNAVDAMPAGGTLSLRTRQDGPEVVVEVADTGEGMDEETRQRCLEPFFTTKGDKGTGLGLATTFGVMQRHEGTIEIHSEKGKGTTISLRLPNEREVGGPEDTPGEQAAPASLRILVVDDDPLVREVIEEYLALDGHRVVAVSSGREALEEFRQEGFDVVFTDRAMPEMNGCKLAAALKALSPDLPVIVLSGFGKMMIASGETPEHVDAIVGKPVRRRDLREALMEVMENAVASIGQ